MAESKLGMRREVRVRAICPLPGYVSVAGSALLRPPVVVPMRPPWLAPQPARLTPGGPSRGPISLPHASLAAVLGPDRRSGV